MTETRRIVLLGKSGAGKSSLANTIFRENNVFKKNNSQISGTKNCQSLTKIINRRIVTLIDTPGLSDTDPESPDLSPEILKCVTACSPGPHAFLLVLKLEMFTRQEQAVIEIILKYFSEEVLNYTTVVFTHGEDLPEGMKIKEWVSQSKALEDLVQLCDGRCHVFDNKHWNNTQDQYRNNKVQVEDLLKTIDTTVIENRRGYFTNELLMKVEHGIQQEKQPIKKSSQNISEGPIRENMADTRRIVLLGKTGAGKSSLANTIFRENVFKVNNSQISGTKNCQSETKSINGRRVTLIDTPGLSDTDPESPDLSPELLKCVTECSPGSHSFLLVLKLEMFTRQEQAVIEIILKYFSEEVLNYTTVVFTHGEDLPEGMKIKEWVNQSKALEDLVQLCDGRCHVFDNKHWNNTQDQYRNNKVQVEELLKTIDTTVIENRGEYFTNELLMKVEHEKQQEKQPIKESSQNISEGHIRENMADTRRIVLLGKTGAGKSSLANTIFGDNNVFKVNNSLSYGTKTCQSQTKSIKGRRVTLIDTPGLFDTDPKFLIPKFLKCLIECAPGPHAFLLLLKVERFTKHEKDVVDKIFETFSEEALKYTTVVFTCGDDLPEGMKIKDWVNNYEALRDLVQTCGGRCHVFDNKYWNNTQDQYRNNKVQVEELLNTIDSTVIENGGGYFTNELLMKVEHGMEQEKQRIKELNLLKEKIKQKVANFIGTNSCNVM